MLIDALLIWMNAGGGGQTDELRASQEMITQMAEVRAEAHAVREENDRLLMQLKKVRANPWPSKVQNPTPTNPPWKVDSKT